MSDNRASVYEDTFQQGDGNLVTKTVYRASGLGKCFRGLVASRLGMEPQDNPEWLKQRFEEGHRAEPWILGWLQKEGWNQHQFRLLDPSDPGSYAGLRDTVNIYYYHDGQFTGQIDVGSNAIIRLHLDGIAQLYEVPVGGLWGAGQKVMVEAKAFGPSYWKKWESDGIEAFPYYMAQLTLCMEATGLPAVFVIGRKEQDEAGDVQEIEEFDVTPFYHPPGNLAEYKMRVMKVERQVATGMLPDCDTKEYPCQWYWTGGACAEGAEEKAKREWFDVDGDLVQKFHEQINNLNAAKVKIENGEREKSAANVELGRLMAEVAGTNLEATGVVGREEPIGNFRLPDGTVIRDTVYKQAAQTREVKEYWVRYPKVQKAKKSGEGEGQ